MDCLSLGVALRDAGRGPLIDKSECHADVNASHTARWAVRNRRLSQGVPSTIECGVAGDEERRAPVLGVVLPALEVQPCGIRRGRGRRL
jgi:hypothetical protein